MNGFESHYSTLSETMKLELHPGFGHDDIQDLMTFFREKMSEGHIRWDFDLTKVELIVSDLIGDLIMMNAMISTQKGTMRLIAARDSHVANILAQAKIDRLIAVKTV